MAANQAHGKGAIGQLAAVSCSLGACTPNKQEEGGG